MTCNAIFTREAILEVGGFDAYFDKVCEDVDLGWRLSTHGFLLLKTPEFFILHHHHPRLWNWNQKIFRYSAGQIKLLKRHRQHRNLPLLLPLATGLLLVSGCIIKVTLILQIVVIYCLLMFAVSLFFFVTEQRVGVYLVAFQLLLSLVMLQPLLGRTPLSRLLGSAADERPPLQIESSAMDQEPRFLQIDVDAFSGWANRFKNCGLVKNRIAFGAATTEGGHLGFRRLVRYVGVFTNRESACPLEAFAPLTKRNPTKPSPIVRINHSGNGNWKFKAHTL